MKFQFFILFLVFHFSYSQQFEVVEIEINGTQDSSINYVIMGDGFTESEQDLFLESARKVTEYIFSKPPYVNYRSFFNIYAIKVISNESGANHPGTGEVDTEDYLSNTHPIKEVDNYFGSSFDIAGIHRLLVPVKYSRIFEVLTTNLPSYDQGLLIVNTAFYGGSGGEIATGSLNNSANSIMFHEIGHSFSNLADEYYAGDVYVRERINMTQETSPTLVKWKNWMGVSEINNNNGSKSPIGIYQYGQGSVSSLWHKPSVNKCLMESLNLPLCEVCREGTVERLHDLVFDFPNLLENSINISTSSTGSTISISVDQRVFDIFDIKWYHNERLIQNDGLSYTFNESLQIELGDYINVVLSDNSSSFLRVNDHENIHNKTIRFEIIDSDNDGVLDIYDQCPNTTLGVNVDANGCEIFLLPANNFSVAVTSSTCAGSENGSISISAQNQEYSYTASISGQSPVVLNSSNNFEASISGLGAGNYDVCFTVAGVESYNQCFSVTVSEPAPLSTSAKIDLGNRSVDLSLNGSPSYNILLNGAVIKTTESNLSLDLKPGMNYISISTDLNCQGTYFEEIFVSEDVLAYPNPTDGMVQLYIGGTDDTVTLNVYDMSSQNIISNSFEVSSSRVIEADISRFKTGIYFFVLNGKTINTTHKIIKN